MKNLTIKEIFLHGEGDESSEEESKETGSMAEIEARIREQVAAEMEEKYKPALENSKSLVQEKREQEALVKEYKTKLYEYEKAQKMDKGQFEEVLEGERKSWKEKINSHLEEANSYKEKATSLEKELKKFKIETAIKSAISKTEGFNVAATDDATNVALGMFNDFDDNNNPIIRDKNGIIKTNKKGENYSPQDFMNDQVEQRSYWWNKLGGSGAGEGGQNPTGTKQFTRNEWNLKLAKSSKEDKAKLMSDYKNGNIEII